MTSLAVNTQLPKPGAKEGATEWGSALDRAQAKEAGIRWQRPDGDRSSAQSIIEHSPLLKNLGNQSGVKDMLKERVGDFEHDADAAFRATQVLDHVVRYDAQGNRLAGNDVDNDRIDGFTKGGDAKHGTEAGRLQDFGKYGWGNLKGELQHQDAAGDNDARREAAEAKGIVWELPKGDDRSAQDIIDANPLLKNLGNQSGVKDALKEQVGDFGKDANAAYRAMQILDRVVGYDEQGKALSGGDVANSSIDGFTKGREARHGTEAGRLQDFGKYGFDALANAQDNHEIGSYKAYLEANPDADAGSRQIAQYGAILEARFDSIAGKTGTGEHLTATNIQDYLKGNPQLSGLEREALQFFSEKGSFRLLDTASEALAAGADGKISRADIQTWVKDQAPTNANSLLSLMTTVTTGNLTGNVDTSALGEDIFQHPEKYTAEQKAAVLLDLQNAQKLVIDGANAGMWGDDYGKVTIANRSGAFWEPDKLLQDINDHMAILEQDPETAKFLKSAGDESIQGLFKDNPELKKAVNTTYEEQIETGKALDQAWDAATKDGKTDQKTALTQFYATATGIQSMLGIADAKAIQEGVSQSAHKEDFQAFFKDELASGNRLRELLKDNDAEKAVAEFSLETALYTTALAPAFTGPLEQQLNDNFSTLAQENLFKGSSFDDLKTAFGKDGGDTLDEDKVRALVDKMRDESPELLMNEDGSVATTDQVLAGVRGNWDMFRQGTKALDKMDRLEKFDTEGSAKGAYNSGTLHGVSGLFLAGVTIARGAQSGGNLSERNIVDITTGSVQTATVLTEGGSKAYQEYLSKAIKNGERTLKDMKGGVLPSDLLKQVKDNVAHGKNAKVIAKNFEEAAKGIGGLAGIVAGAYGIFDGVNALRNGDKVSGGFGITAGGLGVLAGAASAAEGGLGLLGANLPRFLPALASTAGILGFLGAGVAVLGALLPGLIKEGQQQTKANHFGDVLGEAIERYGIDGVKDGTIDDIPVEDWPGPND